jgi:hypothetical protein
LRPGTGRYIGANDFTKGQLQPGQVKIIAVKGSPAASLMADIDLILYILK